MVSWWKVEERPMLLCHGAKKMFDPVVSQAEPMVSLVEPRYFSLCVEPQKAFSSRALDLLGIHVSAICNSCKQSTQGLSPMSSHQFESDTVFVLGNNILGSILFLRKLHVFITEGELL